MRKTDLKALLRVEIEPYYGNFKKEWVAPEDGNYSFIEWDDYLADDAIAITLALVGEKLSDPTGPLEDVIHAGVIAADGTEDLPDVAATVRRMLLDRKKDRLSEWAVEVDKYLMASPQEQAEIERMLSVHPDFGVKVESRIPYKRFTCGNLRGSGFQGVSPGTTVEAITVAAPLFLKTVKDHATGGTYDLFEIKYARLS